MNTDNPCYSYLPSTGHSLTALFCHADGTATILPMALLTAVKYKSQGHLEVVFAGFTVTVKGRNLWNIAKLLAQHRLAHLRAADEKSHAFGPGDVYVARVEVKEAP